MSDCFLRLPMVKARTALSRRTLYRRVADGLFPEPVPLGGRSAGWLSSAIDGWIAQQVLLRDTAK